MENNSTDRENRESTWKACSRHGKHVTDVGKYIDKAQEQIKEIAVYKEILEH